MTVTQADASGGPLRDEFDAFLYSVIREEDSGQALTVLSLLARQDLDPWDEAGDYLRSPREAAIAKLSHLLAIEDSHALARRLLELLPKRGFAEPLPPTRLWPTLVRMFERFKNASRVWMQNDRR